MPFISFLYIITLARTFSALPIEVNGRGYSNLIPYHIENNIWIFIINVISAMGF